MCLGVDDAQVGPRQATPAAERRLASLLGAAAAVAAAATTTLLLAVAPTHLDGGVAVAQVGGDALDVGDIVKAQLGDQLVHLEQQGQRLADAARRAEHRHLLRLDDGHGAGAAGVGTDDGGRESLSSVRCAPAGNACGS